MSNFNQIPGSLYTFFTLLVNVNAVDMISEGKCTIQMINHSGTKFNKLACQTDDKIEMISKTNMKKCKKNE